MTKIRIKTTDVFGNVRYLHTRDDGSWAATLANGIPYCFHQAANTYQPDEMALKFDLEACTTAEQAIEVLQRHAKRPEGQWQAEFEIVAGATTMPHSITLLWAERPDPGDEAKTYRFATKGEYDAFMLGVSEANGWINVREAPEGYVVPDPDDQTDEDEEILSAQMF